jgi:hypothetical protein
MYSAGRRFSGVEPNSGPEPPSLQGLHVACDAGVPVALLLRTRDHLEEEVSGLSLGHLREVPLSDLEQLADPAYPAERDLRINLGPPRDVLYPRGELLVFKEVPVLAPREHLLLFGHADGGVSR